MLHNDPPEYQPDEESYADRWMRAHFSGYSHLGLWRLDQEQPACFRAVPQPERAAA